MSEQIPAPGAFKPKKSVALSGTAAGNTALCTVGRSGNDLHYRGYDILDFANTSEFEEIAYLLVHGKLPNKAELAGYKTKLKSLRGIPAAVKAALEELPPSAHPMDVMRTGVSVLGCVSPEKDDHNHPGARDIADKLMASLGSMLLYWYHWSHNGRAIDVETDDDSHRRPFPAPAAWRSAARVVGAGDAHLADPLRRARIQCLDLRRAGDRRHRQRHAFLHHRRDRCVARAEARRRQRSRVRSAEALRDAGRGGSRHQGARRAQGSGDRLRPPGVHGVRSAQQGDQGRRARACPRSRAT